MIASAADGRIDMVQVLGSKAQEPLSTDTDKEVPSNVTIANAVGADAEELLELGYQPQLKRVRSFAHIFTMTLTFFAVPYGYAAALGTALIGGGPASMVWGYVFVSLGTWCVAYSVGEIASRYPTAAGPYYWTFQLAPRSIRKALSYITGWIFLTGVILSSASVGFGTAQLILATANIVYPDYVFTDWTYVLVAYAVLLSAVAPMILKPQWLPQFDYVATVLTWLVEIAFVIVLAARADSGRRSASFAFFNYETSFSGWGNGWTFFIGCLPAAYINCGIGLVTSMSEEVRDPERAIPKAMIWGVPASLILGWMFALPLTFTLPEISTLLNAPGGVPIALALKLIIGNDAGSIVIMAGIIAIGYFCSVANNTAASRLLWSFSRDDAVPFSRLWSKVDSKGNIPNAIALNLIVQMALVLIYLGSASAYNALAGSAVIAFGIAYLIPVVCSLASKRKIISLAPFGSAFWGPIANVGMVAWVSLATVIFCMPTTLPVTPASMNYASVVLVFFAAGAGIWYFLRAHRTYLPPEHAALVQVGASD